jgi:hypothetical protein
VAGLDVLVVQEVVAAHVEVHAAAAPGHPAAAHEPALHVLLQVLLLVVLVLLLLLGHVVVLLLLLLLVLLLVVRREQEAAEVRVRAGPC